MLFIYFCNYFAVNESFVCCRRRSEQWDARKFRYFAFKMTELSRSLVYALLTIARTGKN